MSSPVETIPPFIDLDYFWAGHGEDQGHVDALRLAIRQRRPGVVPPLVRLLKRAVRETARQWVGLAGKEHT